MDASEEGVPAEPYDAVVVRLGRAIDELAAALAAALASAAAWETRALELQETALLGAAEVAGDPPGADAARELLSVRIPEEQRERLREVAMVLRQRKGGVASQKKLSEQDIVAMALWAVLGAPGDGPAAERAGKLHDRFRNRRLVVELRASES